MTLSRQKRRGIPQDYPFELEIYGLYDGYEDVDGGANIILAIPII